MKEKGKNKWKEEETKGKTITSENKTKNKYGIKWREILEKVKSTVERKQDIWQNKEKENEKNVLNEKGKKRKCWEKKKI